MDPLELSFKRATRLSGRANYRRVFGRGRSVRGDWLALRVLPNESGRTRFGCTIRREMAPRAVQRNRLKRWLRESFRLHSEWVPAGMDLVAVVQRVPRKVDFHSTEKEFLALCGRFERDK